MLGSQRISVKRIERSMNLPVFLPCIPTYWSGSRHHLKNGGIFERLVTWCHFRSGRRKRNEIKAIIERAGRNRPLNAGIGHFIHQNPATSKVRFPGTLWICMSPVRCRYSYSSLLQCLLMLRMQYLDLLPSRLFSSSSRRSLIPASNQL